LVTRQGALRYGVVINEDGTVDAAATVALRAERIAARGDTIPLFNRGGDLEQIRARCEEETHLPAPAQPSFVPRGIRQ